MLDVTPRTVVWISVGAASAVAGKITARAGSNIPVELAYCETGSEHPDNVRFLRDCESWIGHPVTHLRSTEYVDTWDVWKRRKYLAGIEGAPCTVELKVGPRLLWQRPTDTHVFGYTADAPDVTRFDRLRKNYPELTLVAPLIDRGLNKSSCLEMVARAGITLPPMYAHGFHNNNCIPCVKATSPAYWALVRKVFPDKFERMAKLARELDVRLARIDDVRIFIDEIPLDHPTTNPIQPSCDFLCAIEESRLAEPES